MLKWKENKVSCRDVLLNHRGFNEAGSQKKQKYKLSFKLCFMKMIVKISFIQNYGN